MARPLFTFCMDDGGRPFRDVTGCQCDRSTRLHRAGIPFPGAALARYAARMPSRPLSHRNLLLVPEPHFPRWHPRLRIRRPGVIGKLGFSRKRLRPALRRAPQRLAAIERLVFSFRHAGGTRIAEPRGPHHDDDPVRNADQFHVGEHRSGRRPRSSKQDFLDAALTQFLVRIASSRTWAFCAAPMGQIATRQEPSVPARRYRCRRGSARSRQPRCG